MCFSSAPGLLSDVLLVSEPTCGPLLRRDVNKMGGMGHISETSLSFVATAKQAAKQLQAKRGYLQPSDVAGQTAAFEECRGHILAAFRKLLFSNITDAMVRFH